MSQLANILRLQMVRVYFFTHNHIAFSKQRAKIINEIQNVVPSSCYYRLNNFAFVRLSL